MGNPIQLCRGCSEDNHSESCSESITCGDAHEMWQQGFNAGLEAAALEADRVADTHDDWARQPQALPRARAVATAMRILAHDVRAMKGGDEG